MEFCAELKYYIMKRAESQGKSKKVFELKKGIAPYLKAKHKCV